MSDTQLEFDPAEIIRAYDMMVRANVPERTLHLAPEVYLPLCDELLRFRALEAWVKRMPDAGFNEQDPRWGWWHERP